MPVTIDQRDQALDLAGRRDIYPGEIVLMAEVGSTAHGINTDTSGDDLDLTAIRIEPFYELVNGPLGRQSLQVRTQPDGHPSGPGDIDLNIYTLRKFMSLAAKGNPSILAVLYSPTYVIDIYAEEVPRMRALVKSRRAGAAFLGYCTQQIERWEGKRGQKNVNRQDLIERHGFDTKYAAHAIRLGMQGVEYLTEGHISIPMQPDRRELVLDIRNGVYPEGRALEIAKFWLALLENAYRTSTLPDKPDTRSIERWLESIYAIDAFAEYR